uniref:Uncharacterized protein n=1 Tax=Chlamydomonas euryale TaxID=1486919 RepID=A0A7R9VZD4_9CHLO|mmetsp:Transcript_8496/g.25745  ORF Transcript_8496/g.25745 Transcript_8496/m.25745 type:complete len:130 (+) Transcript_8496:193-582(+)|eukprot:364682-Chlamydomonas_euryale.AAC.6
MNDLPAIKASVEPGGHYVLTTCQHQYIIPAIVSITGHQHRYCMLCALLKFTAYVCSAIQLMNMFLLWVDCPYGQGHVFMLMLQLQAKCNSTWPHAHMLPHALPYALVAADTKGLPVNNRIIAKLRPTAM